MCVCGGLVRHTHETSKQIALIELKRAGDGMTCDLWRGKVERHANYMHVHVRTCHVTQNMDLFVQ